MNAGIAGLSPRVLTMVVVFGLLGRTGTARADPITILNDGRGVNVLARIGDSGQTDGQTDSQGPGDVLMTSAFASVGTGVANATARLTSSLTDPAHLSGSGSALAAFSTFGQAQTSAAAVFAVDFLLTAPYLYTFNGIFNISDFPAHSNVAFNEARWAATLSSGGATLLDLGGTHSAFPSNFGGTLPAGTYEFLVETEANGSTERPATVDEDSQFQFALDLAPAPVSPTPEPASLLLLATGVAGVVLRKRRTSTDGVPRIG